MSFLAYLSGIETGKGYTYLAEEIGFLAYLSGIETRERPLITARFSLVFSVPIRN